MASKDSTLGCCPHCDEEVPEAYLLIEYETGAGDLSVFAECPVCGDVVTPEQ